MEIGLILNISLFFKTSLYLISDWVSQNLTLDEMALSLKSLGEDNIASPILWKLSQAYKDFLPPSQKQNGPNLDFPSSELCNLGESLPLFEITSWSVKSRCPSSIVLAIV